MAYKRRYNPKDDEAKLENDRKSRVQELESHSFNYDSGAVDADIPTAGNKTENKDTEFTSEFKDMPNMFIDGKINPAYDSSAFQDALAGIGIGVRSVGNGNPFATIGAAFGGLAGGLVTKNVKGRMDYNRDVQDTIKYNEALEFKTQANIRAEQLAQSKQREARIRENADRSFALREGLAKHKKAKDRIDYLSKQLQTAPTDEAAVEIAELLRAEGVYADPRNRGQMQVKTIGDYVFTVSKGGQLFQVTDQNGNPMADLSTKTYLQIKEQMEDTKDISDEKWVESLTLARELLKKNGIPLKNGGTLVSLAKEIVKGKKSSHLDLGGSSVELDITPTKPFEASKPQASENQLTPNDGLTPPPFVDATAPEANRPNSAAELMPTYDPDFPLVVTDTENKKTYQLREIKEGVNMNSITLPEGRMITAPSGNTYLRKDGRLFLVKKQ